MSGLRVVSYGFKYLSSINDRFVGDVVFGNYYFLGYEYLICGDFNI